ncbi:MAG: pentapeptide repeat-containing protein [Patescibacteria group bacterium]|nr:pentapeptide repeat-containing protein [Patescibacteria group bacterium]MDE2590747.1 pentapeptide repeat-containing protein [Patescibacteria group bacterium]
MKKVHPTKTRIKKQIPHFHPIVSIIALVLGVLGTLLITHVLAQTVSNTIFACVQKETGSLRVVPSDTSCHPDETTLTWNQQGPQGPVGPVGPQGPAGNGGSSPFGIYVCGGCNYTFSGQLDNGAFVSGKDFSNAYLASSQFDNLTNDTSFHPNVTNTKFSNAILTQSKFTNADVSNSNFTNADLRSASFAGAIAVNTIFTNANLSTWIPIGGDFKQATDFSNANLTNANFTGANLTGATNMSTANIAGVIWSNTICPDRTNSRTNGTSPESCVGHL